MKIDGEGGRPMSNIDKQALREELSNPAIGSNAHLRKLALALLDELEAEGRQNGYLREQRDKWERKAISNFEECSEMAQCIEVLESHRQMAFMASNRWSDKFREADKRIVELNHHISMLTAKIEPTGRLVDELTMWVKRLAHSLKYANQLSKLPGDAMDYLSSNGLISVEDVLR